MGTTAEKLQAVLSGKEAIKAALIEKGQSPSDVLSTYGDIIRNMEASEGLTEAIDEQTIVADELVSLANQKYFASRNTGIYVWKKLTAEGGDFIEYVVSGESTTYPDGGEQDGYWYEMVEEGATGIEYGTITLTEAVSALTFPHNFGVKPTKAYLVGNPAKNNSSNNTYVCALYSDKCISMYASGTASGYKDMTIEFVSATSYSATAFYDRVQITESDVTFGPSSSLKRFLGTYIWIVLA